MPYAQQQYPQTQGINGKYRIAQIGCLITAFCNELEWHGVKVDPATLNAWFAAHGTFIDVDDGVRDDLSWSSITAYNPNLTVASVGAGAPAGNGGIVKFAYISPRTGHKTTHFSVWLGGNMILDSWDGKTKNINTTSYGNPVAHATYTFKQSEVVKPVSTYTAVVTANNRNRYTRLATPLDLELKRPAEQWHLNFTKFADAKSNGHHNEGEHFTAFGKYDHPLGTTYFMNEFDFGDADKDGTPTNALGYNTVDLRPQTAPQAPVEAAAPTTTTITSTPLPLSENTVISSTPLTTTTVTIPETDQIPVTVIPADPAAWKGTFKTNSAGYYVAVADEIVFDYGANPAKAYPLTAGQKVHVLGDFQKGNSKYYRASKQGADMWVGIPMSKITEVADDEMFAELSQHMKQYDASMKAGAIKTMGRFDGLVIRFTNVFRKNKKI